MEIFSSIRALTQEREPLRITPISEERSSDSLLLNGRQAFSLLMGGEPTASGEHITEHSALKISWVYAAVRVIAETVGSLPLKIYEQTPDGEVEARDHTLSYALSVEPNQDMSAPVALEQMAGCIALTGNAYLEILRDTRKNVIGWYPLNPLNVTPQRNGKTNLVEYVVESGQDKRIIAAKDMIHVPLWSMDGLRGLSPIQLQSQTLGFAQATLKSGARFIGNGFLPRGILAPSGSLTKEQSEQVRKTLEDQSSGNNQGRLAVLPAPFDYKQLGLSLTDSAFLATRALSRNEIAAIFRLDPHHLGDTTRQSNSNAEQASLSLMQDTIAPYLSKITAEFNRKLLPMVGKKRSSYVIRFDLTERNAADRKTTLDSLALGRQWSLLTVDEARKQLGLNRIGGDVGNSLMAPINMMNAEKWTSWQPSEKGNKNNE